MDPDEDEKELDDSWGKPDAELEYDENEQPKTIVIDLTDR